MRACRPWACVSRWPAAGSSSFVTAAEKTRTVVLADATFSSRRSVPLRYLQMIVTAIIHEDKHKPQASLVNYPE